MTKAFYSCLFGISLFLFGCSVSDTPSLKSTPNFQNKGHRLIYEMVEKVGTYQDLLALKDVMYTYTYETPTGEKDVSLEKYIFNGELSMGEYHQHERTLPEYPGDIVQGYDGKEYWLTANKMLVDSVKAIERVKFNRPTNFYWFAMFPKLLDPGLNYEYLGEEKVANAIYDIVKVTFEENRGKPTDIYQVYINQSTQLVDRFLFTVVDFGVIDLPYLMELEYEEIEGLFIPAIRRYKKSDWKGTVSNEEWTKVTWTNITFNNGLDTKLFLKPKVY